jgi:hypothetical protein
MVLAIMPATAKQKVCLAKEYGIFLFTMLADT